MKIVFDFDGVLTDQTEEALRVQGLFKERLIERSQQFASETTKLLEAGEQELQANPAKHGWKEKGRIAAFASEDYFMHNVGLANCLQEWAEEGLHGADHIREAIQDDFPVIAQQCYMDMVAETRAGKHHPLDPKSKSLFADLLAAGHEIVVVSNSSTDRILNIFESIDLVAKDHKKDPSAPLRVRGDAGKFHLGDSKQGFFVGDYWIDTDRPGFEKILREEKPAVALGDVFSLDLALLYHLSKNEPKEFGHPKLILREQKYTPQWSQDFCLNQNHDHASLFSVNDLDQVRKILMQ